MKVFIVDDSILIRERLTGVIHELPFAEIVGQAGDMRQAVEGIERFRPDVVLLDIRLPGGSGLDILQSIRATYPDMKVVILTNYSFPQYRERAGELGADAFLEKALEFEKIMGVLEKLNTALPRAPGNEYPQQNS